MLPPLDVATRELSSARLRLVDGLSFHPFFRRRVPLYRVQTAERTAYFEIGRDEATFISLLDGRTTVAEAVSALARTQGAVAFTETDAVAVCHWLLNNELARSAESVLPGTPADFVHKSTRHPLSENRNPLSFRIPLLRSDAWLDQCVTFAKWVHSGPAFVIGLIIVLFGALRLVGEWPRFQASAADLWIPDHWLWTGLLWCFLKALHELSHALACKRYGGKVHEMGIAMTLFAPVAYVDVSSSWSYSSRWQRMHVAAAGVSADFLLAALAAIAWSQTESVWLQYVLSRTIWLCTLTTILFNLNPLVRCDGYYLLADACDIPNLFTRSRSAVAGWLEKLFFGSSIESQGESTRLRTFYLIYGVASGTCSFLMVAVMLFAAAMWLDGLGILLAGAGSLIWFGPSVKHLTEVAKRHVVRRPASLLRFVTVSALSLGLGATALCLLPWPASGTAPFVVDFTEPAVVRAESPGFVQTVLVHDRAMVTAGDLLLKLDNPDLAAELQGVAVQVQAKAALARAKLNEGHTAAAQVATHDVESLRRRHDELTRRVKSLEIRAPIDGRVIARNLNQLEGNWCELGQTLLTIAPDSQKQLKASVSQEDVELVRADIGKVFEIWIPARGAALAELKTVAPRATVEVPHPGLVTLNGGPLAARPVENAGSATTSLELLQPCFSATLQVNSTLSEQLVTGETGFVRLHSSNRTLYEHLSQRLHNKYRSSAYH